MLLRDLLKEIKEIKLSGPLNDIEVMDIQYDSRKVTKGSLFVCIDGYKVDGHKFINEAITKGAVGVAVSKDVCPEGKVILIKHPDTRKLLAELSGNFYGNPTQKINLIGVTGTKGKTTTTFMIKSILEGLGHKVGLIGTIANYVGDKIIPAERTTPESLELQQMFSEMKSQGVDTVVMEVSSHSLDLYRVHACDFDIGIFTNLSRDHLDFHLNFENYFAAKSKLFNMCKTAVINIDDMYGQRLLDKCRCEVKTFGINKDADFGAEDIEVLPQGTSFNCKNRGKSFKLGISIPGKFSVYNALAAITACDSYTADEKNITDKLKTLKVPGRAEIVETNRNFSVMVDYAHSPDSLDNILQAVNIYAKGRVVVIFGCGGDRDKTKRPIMGEIAGRLAGFTIITSDNPRSENEDSIIKEIEEGIKRTEGEYIIISDRRLAIEFAIRNAKENDIIVIAGKGHETYQIFKDNTIHFDDREIAREVLKELEP